MAAYSDIFPITTSASTLLTCGVGKEVTVFGLVFTNSTGAIRTVTLRFYRQANASTIDIPVYVPANSSAYSWPKAISLLPSDSLSVLADATGVSVLYSADVDDGVTPVATGFVPRGVWSSVGNYVANDVVSKNGSSYIAIQASTNQDPVTQTAYWLVAAAKGETGSGSNATDVVFTPTGGISATNAQAAIAELDTEKATPAQVTAAVSGKQSMPIVASAMIPNATNGPTSSRLETTTNKVMLTTLDFDATTAETAQFTVPMPKSWNEGTITFKYIWRHAATTTNFGVAFGVSGVAFSDDDASDAAFGTEVIVTDTGGTTNDVYQSAESSAVTIAGTPVENDVVVFKVRRVVADGADTMAIDAGLIAVVINITTNAGNDT